MSKSLLSFTDSVRCPHPKYCYQIVTKSEIKASYNLRPVLRQRSELLMNNWLWCTCIKSKRPVVQIPYCTSPISHNATFLYHAMHHLVAEQNGALWDICLMHYGICEMGLLISEATYCALFWDPAHKMGAVRVSIFFTGLMGKSIDISSTISPLNQF